MEPQVKSAENLPSLISALTISSFNGAASKICGKRAAFINNASGVSFASMEPQVKSAENVTETVEAVLGFWLQWSRK